MGPLRRGVRARFAGPRFSFVPDFAPRRPRVLVVSADALVRDYLAARLARHPLLGELGVAEPSLAPGAFEGFDVVLWDAATAEAPGSPSARALLPPVVLLSDADEDRGLAGLDTVSAVRREASADVLAAALSAAAEGLWVLDPAFVERARPRPAPDELGSVSLTAREQEVLVLLAEGLGNKLGPALAD